MSKRQYNKTMCARITARMKAWINGRPCYLCGGEAQFADHVDPATKTMNASNISNDAKFYREMEHCEPVCMPCNSRKGQTIDHDRRGEKAGGALLTAAFVTQIRYLIRDCVWTQPQAAKRYGVSRPCVNNLMNGYSWAWLPFPP